MLEFSRCHGITAVATINEVNVLVFVQQKASHQRGGTFSEPKDENATLVLCLAPGSGASLVPVLVAYESVHTVVFLKIASQYEFFEIRNFFLK